MNYEKRVCCFIDILGFKKHIEETVTESGEDSIEKIKSIKSILKLSKRITKDNGLSKSKVITYFSDSIVISYKYDEPGQLFYTLLDLLYVAFELANKGYLTRGGISIGKLLHTTKYIFGPALVEAYEIESKKAVFPRIIVSKEVLTIGAKYAKNIHSENDEKGYIMDLLNKDTDGFYYIDYITKSSTEFDDPEFDLYLYIESLKNNFFLNYANENESVREKLDWLKLKLNAYIKQIKENIKDPVFSQEIVGIYTNLNELK